MSELLKIQHAASKRLLYWQYSHDKMGLRLWAYVNDEHGWDWYGTAIYLNTKCDNVSLYWINCGYNEIRDQLEVDYASLEEQTSLIEKTLLEQK